MICMAALLMMAVSCKKENKTSDKGEGFRATIESYSGDCKTHLEGLAVKWDNGDAIKVLTCSDGANFSTDATSSPALFEATGDLPANFYTPPYTGYYPATAFSGDQLTLPATQNYVENTFANGANPMAAASSETLLPFKNVCGVLKLQLYSTTACQVRSISITSNTGEKLCGTGTVTLTGGVPALGTLSNGGSTLTLLMGEGGKAMSTSGSAPTAYYFVVPVGTLGTSFTVKVTETNGNVWSMTFNAPQYLIARSQITVLPKHAVATNTPVVPSEVTLTAGCSSENIYNGGGSVTVPYGTHTCEFGLVYSATIAEPTLDNGTKVVAGTATFSGTKTFSADITGLAAGTTYHVRAYAMIEGAAYSTAKDIVVGTTPLPLPSNWTNGKNPHPFTVASGKVVYFSQGNLQYNATGSSATAASGANVGGTWRFAEHQFDFIGEDNKNVAQTYGGWIDLFGWGTSGYNHNGKSYQPWSTSTTDSQYYAYGSSSNNLYNSDGTADWGANAISNGGGSSWRTLTDGGGFGGEWYYLFISRPNAASLYGMGKVGSCTPGLIILPDDWSWTGDVAEFGPSVTEESRRWKPGKTAWLNVYSYSEWSQMEAAGAVFLPAAGYRDGTSVYCVGSNGSYWSSQYGYSDVSNFACYLYFSSGGDYSETSARFFARSVRLVSEN